MPNNLLPEDVFVTEGFPKHTYVDSAGGKPEADLKDALAQQNKIVSIVGASKTGKSTLCDKYFGTEKGVSKIYVTGDSIAKQDSFWREVWGQIENQVEAANFYELPHSQIVDTLVKLAIPIIVDDFHYIPLEVQKSLCRQMKNAASQGLRFVVLNTPHRGDDPVRSNPDLSGRFFSVDMGFWAESDLASIARTGFKILELEVEQEVTQKLAREALKSPQLMQTLCLETCRILPSEIPFVEQIVTIENFKWELVRDRAVRSYQQPTQLDYLKNGPEERGSERLVYTFTDGSTGDVYDVLLRIIALDPPFEQLDLDDIKFRMKRVCQDKKEPNIRAALNQISKVFKEGSKPVEWDDVKRTFSIIDPHFYFYLRTEMVRTPK